MKEPVLVIMAAGMGSRFGGLKQIEPINECGEIILDFSLYDAYMAGFKKAIFIIKEENKADFEAILKDKAGKHMDIEYVFQKLEDIPEGFSVPEGRKKPWGTGHAVLATRNSIDGPFAVINADDYYGPGAFQLIYDFLENAKDKEKYDYCMAGYQLDKTLTENGHVSRGVCQLDEQNCLTNITERTKIKWMGDKIVYTEDEEKTWHELDRNTIVSMNFWGFTRSMINELKERFPDFLKDATEKSEFYLPKVVDQLLSQNKAQAKVLMSEDRWYGITYREDKEGVVDALQALKDKGIYPDVLWK